MASTGKQQVAEQGSGRVPTTLRDFFFNDPIFHIQTNPQTNLEDFDQLQSAMMKEPRDLFKKMDEDFRYAVVIRLFISFCDLSRFLCFQKF